MRAGFAPGCGLHNGSYTCNTGGGNNGNSKCFQNNADRCDGGGKQFLKSQNIDFDNVFLKGGGPDVQTGACCLNNTTCQEILEADCQAQGGTFNGILSTCANTVCCHSPIWADTDGDGDVDMDDFAVFQTCYTGANTGVSGACRCLDPRQSRCRPRVSTSP